MDFTEFLKTANITDTERQILASFRENLGSPSKICKKIFVYGCAGIRKT